MTPPLRAHDHTPAPTLQTRYRDGHIGPGWCCDGAWQINGGGFRCGTCDDQYRVTVERLRRNLEKIPVNLILDVFYPTVGEPRETAVEGVG